MSTMSLLELAARLAIDAKNVEISTEASLAQSAALICDVAKDSLGEYQPGWQQLAPATIARKATGDSPLLEKYSRCALPKCLPFGLVPRDGLCGSNGRRLILGRTAPRAGG